MARPPARDLTDRELDVMHVFWDRGEAALPEVHAALAEGGHSLAYTTVATVAKILVEKGYLTQTGETRPFRYAPARGFEEVSGSMLGGLLDRVFGGSRELLLTRLMEQKRLTKKERAVLEEFLSDDASKRRGGR